jgi:hypothetical protein
MEDIIVINRIQRYIRESIQGAQETLLSGGIDSMEKYQYIVGQVRSLQNVQQEISNLLDNNKEQNDG